MKKYQDFTREELQQEKELLMKKYKEYQDLHLNLNMARGKPGADQLALSMPMLDVLNSASDCHDKYGTDARNYQKICDACIRFSPVLFGPAQMKGMHGLNEYLDTVSLPGAVDFYKGVIQKIR